MRPPPGRVQNGPYVVLCEPGKHAWCRCRRSASFPLCDGSHRGTGTTPLKVVLDQATRVAWCCCGRTGNPPFCDGSHSEAGDDDPEA